MTEPSTPAKPSPNGGARGQGGLMSVAGCMAAVGAILAGCGGFVWMLIAAGGAWHGSGPSLGMVVAVVGCIALAGAAAGWAIGAAIRGFPGDPPVPPGASRDGTEPRPSANDGPTPPKG